MSRAPFRWTTNWSGIILSDDNLLLPNTWTIKLEYNTVSDNMLHRDIAMQRLEFMVEEKFNTATWTNFENPWVAKLYGQLDIFCITLPSDPYDSLIAAVTLLKAQSITRGVFDIKSCSIVSKLGYDVENYIEYDEAEDMSLAIDHPHLKEGPWFMRPDAGFTDLLVIEDEQPTLIKDISDWKQHELNWDVYDNKENNVSALNSYSHNNREERWIPLVIKGGASTDNNDED